MQIPGSKRTNLLSLAQRIWGMDVTQARKLKEMEKENAQLKKLVADLSLDNAILKEVLGKK
jgi:putative transposase